MSFKSLGRKATAKMGRQLLPVKTHSPVLLLGVGAIGFTTSVVLACRATLKLSDVLEKGQENLKKVDAAQDSFEADEIQKATFGVRLQVAIDVVKLYAPAALIGTASLLAVTGSYAILTKRNAGLAAAYTVVDQSFKEYRGRVVKDVGEEKDFEYLHGVEEVEIVVQTDDGPVLTAVKGLDQEKIENANPETTYSRVFNKKNKYWSDVPNQNQYVIQMVQSEANDLLIMQGYLFLNQVYDMLGYPNTMAGQAVGWVRNPEAGKGDGYVNFGRWKDGYYEGMKWLNGDSEALLLDFNVDGVILGALPKA